MATPQKQEDDDDDDDIDPIKMLLPNHVDDEHKFATLQDGAAKSLVQHQLRSIECALVTRQLPSEGLSFQLWPAATTLVTLLDNHRCNPSSSALWSTIPALTDGQGPRPLNILELGSGTGIVGIAAAVTLGANVTVTDLPHVIPNLQYNVDANATILALQGGTVNVAPLKWGEESDLEAIGRDFDLVLASDVVYHDHLYEPLIQTLHLIMGGEKKKNVFVMAHLRRWKKDAVFFKRARKLFDVDTIHVDKPSEGARIGVVVYRFSVKGQKFQTQNI